MTTTSTRRASGTGKATRTGKATQSGKGTRTAHTVATATGSRGGTSRANGGGRTGPATAARGATGRRGDAAKAAQATGTAHSIATTDTAHGGSDERVRAALTAAGGQTVERLAEATGLGKSTVAKALVRLETAGQATRTRGAGTGRTRQPDQWNPAPATTGRRRPTGSRTTPATTDRTQAQTVPATAGPATTGTAKTAAATGGRLGAGTRPKAGERNLATNTVKLAPGDLTRLVADHFAANPNTVLTPGQVGRSLGRSPGAVRNAADKLTREGTLRRLDGAPRRYATAA